MIRLRATCQRLV